MNVNNISSKKGKHLSNVKDHFENDISISKRQLANLKVKDLLSICSGNGFTQNFIFYSLVVMNFIQAFIEYSLFYIYYQPEYLCVDSNSQETYSCTRSEACSSGQDFKFDPGKLNQPSKVSIMFWTFHVKIPSKVTTHCS